MKITILTPEEVDLLTNIVLDAWEADAITDARHDEALGILQGELHGEG